MKARIRTLLLVVGVAGSATACGNGGASHGNDLDEAKPRSTVSTPLGGSRRAVGSSQVVSVVADPGFPEGIAINGKRVYVGTPAMAGQFGDGKVLVFDLETGAPVQEYVIPAQDPSREHNLSCIAFDAQERLYVIDTQLGIVRIDIASGTQSSYSEPFPNLPPCSAIQTGACSPTPTDTPPLPNDIAFDAAGNAYVTDTLQATIWRVRPGGGVPEIWFQDAALGTGLGANGIRIHPDGAELYFTATGPGYVYALPLVDRPAGASLRVVRQYVDEGPDGIAFSASGDLYVALAGSNQISVLAPDGSERRRFSGPAQHGSSSVPWDMPANLAFDSRARRVLVTNHAMAYGAGSSDRFVVFDVHVDDVGAKLVRPSLP